MMDAYLGADRDRKSTTKDVFCGVRRSVPVIEFTAEQ